MPPRTRSQAGPKKVRRKEKKNVAHGHAHIKSTFNNTIVSITDPNGAGSRGGEVSDGSLHRTHAPQVPPAQGRPRRRRPGVRASSLPARPARPDPDQGDRVPAAGAGEAEGQVRLRRAGEAVLPLLRGGEPPGRQD